MKRIKSLMPLIITVLIFAALVFIIFRGSKPDIPITAEINNSNYYRYVAEIRSHYEYNREYELAKAIHDSLYSK